MYGNSSSINNANNVIQLPSSSSSVAASSVAVAATIAKNTNNNSSNEVATLVSNLLEAILLCRPSDVIAFIQRYFEDEVSSAPSSNHIKASHACHILPFLILNPMEFRITASIIFCNHCTIKGTVDKKILKTIYSSLKSDYFMPPTIIDRITDLIWSDKLISKDEEDFEHVIIDNHDRIKFIEKLCHNNKAIKFESFLTYFRLLIGCFYASKWFKEVVYEYIYSLEENVSASFLKKLNFINIESQHIDDTSNLINWIKRLNENISNVNFIIIN